MVFKQLSRWVRGSQTPTVDEVLDAYGALMEKYPTAIMDCSLLPMPKEQMKAFLKTVFASASMPMQQKVLEIGFVFLSHFQNAVGPQPIEIGSPRGTPIANDLAAMDTFLSWQKRSVAEAELLLREWKGFLDGDPI